MNSLLDIKMLFKRNLEIRKMASALFKKLLERVPKETEEEVERSMTHALRIHKWMRKAGISQVEFAKFMDESEDRISRWLSGMYNFTTQDLIKIEDFFERFSAPISNNINTQKITRNGNKLASKQSKLLQKSNIIEMDNQTKNERGKFEPFSISTQASIVVEKYE
jgi:transcriptional regulator with XRE-family HTH domain